MQAQESPKARAHAPLPLLALALLCAFLALCAAACGTTSLAQNGAMPSLTTTSTASYTPVLACKVRTQVTGIDTILETLSCHVHGAAPSDTSFTLAYSAGGPKLPPGQPGPTVAPCIGSLQNGAGSCTQHYSLIAPYGSLPGSVAGELLPSHRHLGPVTPVVAA